MLNIGQTKHRLGNGLTRRALLQIGSLGTGLTLADLLRLQAQGAIDPRQRAKSVIMVYLWGGISHIDTYDMKPLAPLEFRGEFQPIQSNVAGTELCELLPLQATIADKFSIVRGLRSYHREHGEAFFEQASGFAAAEKPQRPALGSVISKLRGESVLPPFVNLAVTQGNVLVQHDPTYLGAAHRAVVPQDNDLENLVLRRMTPDRLAERRSLLHTFDRIRRDCDARGEMGATDVFQERALQMILSGNVRDAFDVKREPESVRAKFADFPQLLQARRLVESGVSLVTLLGPTIRENNGSWDTHANNFKLMRPALPAFDRGIHTLLTDLYERGLDQDVLVVVWGEFGRTPRINKEAGRDHWASANCILFAGGGLQMGLAIGHSGPRGEQDVTGRRYAPQNVAATIYHVLGIDPTTTLQDRNGRPIALLDDREKITELL